MTDGSLIGWAFFGGVAAAWVIGLLCGYALRSIKASMESDL